MRYLDFDNWLRLWDAIRAKGDAVLVYDRLLATHSEPPRHYHGLQHMSECLTEFEEARTLARQPDAVELALWFHDAVYDPRSHQNEERSAGMAGEFLEGAGLPGLVSRVSELILSTRTHVTRDDPDAALVVDVDLGILGQPAGRFEQYEAQIRAEYEWVPIAEFNSRRAAVLQGFLDRPRIYGTDHFHQKFEQSARRNLTSSIRRLTGAIS